MSPHLPIEMRRYNLETFWNNIGSLSTDMLPPRQTSKSSSIPKKIRPRKKPDQLERINMEGCNERGHQCLTNQAKIRRSLSDVQTKEVEGFKALRLKVEKEGSKQGVANKFPSLQEKGRLKSDEKMARKPYNLSEAWNVKSSTLSIPKWAAAAVDNEDMKAQIKFWARAVASNVRPPGPRVLITSHNC